MNRIPTVVIGAGQAGLAMSRALSRYDHQHVVLERGRVAQSWTERWDSLRLLTPNWMSRLPDWRYRGDDPHGFMTRDEVVEYLGAFARSFRAPVAEETAVLSVARGREAGSFRVETDRGVWTAGNVVVATGHCAQARTPACAAAAPAGIHQVTSLGYRNPGQLPEGGVLVVGASASGVQLADELRRSGRRVVVAVGSHNRLPRTYRGRDIVEWLDRLGTLDREIDAMTDAGRARREPSLQLVGRPDRATLDLASLRAEGVELAGRLVGFDGPSARFADDLVATVADADRRLRRLLDRIDLHIAASGDEKPAPPPAIAEVPTDGAPTALDLRREGISSILWATGYSRSYPWLQLPVLDERGEIRHYRGRTPVPGLFVLGLQFLIRRRSSFLDGVGRDAEELAQHIFERQDSTERAVA